MTVLDAAAVVAFLRGEPGRPEVEALLRSREDPPRISAVNVAEVVDVLVRRLSIPEADVAERLDWLEIDGLEVVPADARIGFRAGRLHARHYDRATAPLSLADCVALATALETSDRLATSDPPLAEMARAEGCDVVALPDSTGRRP